MNELNKLEKTIRYEFKDKAVFRESIVHRSYLNESTGEKAHNERLEFLGDAVLELVVTEYLYTTFAEAEGVLTNWRSALVRGSSLSKIASIIDLNNYILTSRGEKKSSPKAKEQIAANALEALIGAIYLDGGYKSAKIFIDKFVINNLEKIIEDKLYIDPKSKLQEIAQENFKITPNYKIISEEGPDHNKTFECAVYIGDKELARGIGKSKALGEQEAARIALEDLADSAS